MNSEFVMKLLSPTHIKSLFLRKLWHTIKFGEDLKMFGLEIGLILGDSYPDLSKPVKIL